MVSDSTQTGFGAFINMKKAIVNNALLSRHLKSLAPAIKKNAVIPALTNVLMEFGKDRLTITGTDLETRHSITMDCDCAKPFTIMVEYSDVSTYSSNAAAPIEFDATEKNVILISGTYKATLPISDVTLFPAEKQEKYTAGATVNADFFYSLYVASLFVYADIKNNNPRLDSPAINIEKGRVTVIGTDAIILYKNDMSYKTKGVITKKLPMSFISSCKSMGDAELSVGETSIKAETDWEVVVSVLTDQQYPDYNAVIPNDVDYKCAVEVKEFSQKAKRVSFAVNAVSNLCVLFFEEKELTITASDVDYEKESFEKVSINNGGDNIKIGFSLKHLMKVLDNVGGDNIKMALTAHNRPLMIKNEEENGALFMIMPLLINNN